MDQLQKLDQFAIPAGYDDKRPGDIYFQEGVQNTHYQDGRIYDASKNQYPPDVKTLWARRMAVPHDLRLKLVMDNRRKQVQEELDRLMRERDMKVEEEMAKLDHEMAELQQREEEKNLRPLSEFNVETAVQTLPPLVTFPEESNLSFLNKLVPLPQLQTSRMPDGPRVIKEVTDNYFTHQQAQAVAAMAGAPGKTKLRGSLED